MKSKQIITNITRDAGISINGNKPYDIQVHNEKFYNKVISEGSLGLGESYMDGWWDSEQLDETFNKLLSSNAEKKLKLNLKDLFHILKLKLFNFQSKKRAFQVGKEHYDLGNDLYKLMLDKRLVYTCAYWKNAKTLNQAQENKLDLICRKINLKKNDKIFDLGCGWASFCKFAAEKYKAKTTGITISKEQAKLGKELTKNLPVKIILQDYRDSKGKFDHIVSIGVMEHIGSKNYKTFLKKIHSLLNEEGLVLLQTIGKQNPTTSPDPWITKYIFPNGQIPSQLELTNAISDYFIIEDWHNLGPDYDKTLMAWHENFNKNWDKLKDKYSNRFKRMWNYYLLSCAAAFRARKLQLWQLVLSKKGVKPNYIPIR